MTPRRKDIQNPSPDPPKTRAARRAPSNGGRVTIRDVAEQAGVSLGTASNVLNRPDIVAPETDGPLELQEDLMTKLDLITIEDLCLRAQNVGVSGDYAARLDFSI